MSIKVQGITVLVFLAYLACVWCEETEVSTESSETTSLEETGRRHRFHGLHRWWGVYGLHALAVFYWLKVKAVIVAFLVGSALVWGFRYLKTNRGCSEIIHESPVIEYDHGPAWSSGPHDHIPYSLDHNPYEHDHHEHHDHHDFAGSDIVSDSFPSNDPYSAYSESYGQADPTVPTAAGAAPLERRGRQLDSEKQVSEIVFGFLGVNNDACRRRFICEMEFRAKENPITRMAFGIVGRGLFSRYVNGKNANGRATSFSECAIVNPDCSLIEENVNNNSENEVANETSSETADEAENEARSLPDQPRDLEKENEANLKAEAEAQQTPTPASEDPIARAIFTRSQASN